MKILPIIVTFFVIIFTVSCNKIINDSPINETAALPSSFEFNFQHQKVVALYFDKKKGTISTLYGNDLALESASDTSESHLAGEVYTMVTWNYVDNPQWFGGYVPREVKEVEVVKLLPSAEGYIREYSRYLGKNLVLNVRLGDSILRTNEFLHERADYILSQRAAVFL